MIKIRQTLLLKPALDELTLISNEKSRKHIQKLVFTNLIDRFDYCVDKTLLILVETDDNFSEELLEHHTQPILENNVLRLFLSGDQKDFAITTLKNTLKQTTLTKRHSTKLHKLLKSFGMADNDSKKHKVNYSTGHILDSFKKQGNKIPPSILGYSDWLYSRRNAIVHGGGANDLLENDIKYLKRNYKVEPSKTLRLSLASIKTASWFYGDLVKILTNI